MKRTLGPIAALSLMLAACSSTPESRIGDQQALFDSFPPEVQQKIRAGQVDVGFTPDMARMALGEPERKYERTSGRGVSEVWAYRDSQPTFSVGLGGGSFGGSGGFGGGVGVATGGESPEDRLRLVFENGKVASVERTLK
jgi:hypothetical protein